jgi:hypothetical protein
MSIRSDEIEIRGSWIRRGQEVIADDNCRRIEHLIESHLKRVGHDTSGWDTLYRDPKDGRYWELIYPQSDLHGGGPPTLRHVGPDELRKKYGVVQ